MLTLWDSLNRISRELAAQSCFQVEFLDLTLELLGPLLGFALQFLDLMLQFTHSFNDNKNSFDTFSGPGFVGHSNETNQTFVVGMGPRLDFLPSDYRVRPYGLFQIEWDHFAYFNQVDFNHHTLISGNDQDAFGVQAGLGIEGTVFELYEHRADRYPLLELTVGLNGSYHHAFQPGRPDKQFVTTLASFGVRF